MFIYLVWEIYSDDWKLIRKGARFMSIEDPALIDVDVDDWADDMANAFEVERESTLLSHLYNRSTSLSKPIFITKDKTNIASAPAGAFFRPNKR